VGCVRVLEQLLQKKKTWSVPVPCRVLLWTLSKVGRGMCELHILAAKIRQWCAHGEPSLDEEEESCL
jgi:uncharacterized protein (DUF302 family)